ncbi:MAG TPA: DUF4398 domain-containing protein [Polyangiaceae bacterium]|jgi:hypothetical protein
MRIRLIATFLVLAGAQGCGGVYYAATVNAASSRLEEAREIGAEELAPYEYYYARAHLDQAQVEAADGSYGDAVNYAEAADEYAKKAIDLSEAAHRAAGRE